MTNAWWAHQGAESARPSEPGTLARMWQRIREQNPIRDGDTVERADITTNGELYFLDMLTGRKSLVMEDPMFRRGMTDDALILHEILERDRVRAKLWEIVECGMTMCVYPDGRPTGFYFS